MTNLCYPIEHRALSFLGFLYVPPRGFAQREDELTRSQANNYLRHQVSIQQAVFQIIENRLKYSKPALSSLQSGAYSVRFIDRNRGIKTG